MALSPTQYQDFRLLLRTCRKSFVAIKDQGIPIIDELLPLCTGSPIVLVTLLSLAAYIRTRRDRTSPEVLGETAYDTALAAVQRDATSLGDEQWDDPVRIQVFISTAILLVLLSFNGPGDNWHRHTSRIVSLIDCLDLQELKRNRRSLFLIMTAATFDISALSIGKTGSSVNAWQRWGLDDIAFNGQISHEAGNMPRFLPFEVQVGYPHSLMSLIVCASKMADSHSEERGLRDLAPQYNIGNEAKSEEAILLELMLERWEPPLPPVGIGTLQEQALRTAWRIIQKAAMIFHMRRRGFRANVLLPLPDPSNSQRVRNMIDDMLLGLRWLLLAWHSEGIPIANAMTWSIAVIGCECGGPGLEDQQTQLCEIMDAVMKSFDLTHLVNLRSVLDLIWIQKQQREVLGDGRSRFMSLELAANLKGCTVPLF